MQETNQGPIPDPAPPDPEAAPGTPPVPETATEPAPGEAGPAAAGPPIRRGLRVWFVLIGTLGFGGVLLGQAELALSAALAGAFVAAQAADRDPAFRALHRLLAAVIVAGGALAFGGLSLWLASTGPPAMGPVRAVAVGIAAGGAILCLLSALPAFARGLAAAVFRTTETTHTLRLAARLVMMGLLVVIPGWAASPGLLERLAERSAPLLGTGELVGSLLGLSLLALGAVGFLVRRDLRGTLARLGLRVPRPAHLGVAALAIPALYLLNIGAELVEQRWFPDLWASDQRINQLLAGGLGVGGGVLLGVSAGVGEELAMRGALQPKLGLVLTALLFAGLHVHYSWFGIVLIFVLGLLLGVLRNRTSTTVAILVHALYDIAAVLTTGEAPGRP